MERMKGLYRRLNLSEHALFMMSFVFLMLARYFVPTTSYFLITVVMLPWSMGLAHTAFRNRRIDRTTPNLLLLSSVVIFTALTLIQTENNFSNYIVLWYLIAYATAVMHPPVPMDTGRLHAELHGIGLIFLLSLTPLSLLALKFIFTGDAPSLLGVQVGPVPGRPDLHRLGLFSYPNITAVVLNCAILFGLYLFIRHRQRAIRALLVAAIAILLLALIHTQSRVGIVALSVALGAVVFRWAYLKRAGQRWRIAVALLLWAAISVGMSYFLSLMVDVTMRAVIFLTNNEFLIENYLNRFSSENLFDVGSTGRKDIWLGTLCYLRDHLRYLAVGMGPVDVTEIIGEFYPRVGEVVNLHNSLLESLVRGGLPHFTCTLGFLAFLIRPALKLLTAPSTEETRGLFLIPLLVGMLFIMGMAESILFCEARLSNLLFFYGCGLLLHYGNDCPCSR
ncbi:MAG: O-antigen ligase family protein [Christensenellales bacterium]|nr:O-antigen ligase family protein [Christensenellales bacterium]